MPITVVDEENHRHVLADENFADPTNPTLEEVVNATKVVHSRVEHTNAGDVVVEEVKEKPKAARVKAKKEESVKDEA